MYQTILSLVLEPNMSSVVVSQDVDIILATQNSLWYKGNMDILKRKQNMKSLRSQGMTLQKIGDKYSVTRERVRQIVNDVHTPKAWRIASHAARRTCFICRVTLKFPARFCEKCMKENKLYQGRDLPRGIVRGRDKNTCQVCGYKWKGTEKKRLDVHHLEGFCGKMSRIYDKPETLYRLITVCHKCHYNLHDHRKYGLKK